MKRPNLINFNAFKSKEQISLKAFVSKSRYIGQDKTLRAPIKNIGLIRKNVFKLKISGLDKDHNIIFQKDYYTDSYGILEIKITTRPGYENIEYFQVYEVASNPGVGHILGTYFVTHLKEPKKLVISDFDKTLCDTKFSSLTEIYNSLRTPLDKFPIIHKSIELVNNAVKDGYTPFILSASPHFYEKAISNWLYKNKLYTSNIFLKDYRDFLSLSPSLLTFKDVKKQGFYKLSQIVKIISLTGIPDKLMLLGDGFEADSLIYLTLYSIIKDKEDPWLIWNKIKHNKVFQLTNKQHTLFLSKLYQISEEAKRKPQIDFSIHIRCTKSILEATKNKRYDIDYIDKNLNLINFYIA
ncbi:MAG: hypothetical protein N4A33_01205 [Bacteriovoracaceae bacterium]|jgi:phosphatidate phosphatase APP1|nr:hypothetical protein [Bacteriovoracaceae bacterium]